MKNTKYTKKDREEAAWLCAVIASDRAGDVGGSSSALDFVHLSDNERAVGLAGKAFSAVPWDEERGFFATLPEQYAEAESWIRTGWTPG